MIQPTNAQQAYPYGGANAVNINIHNPQAYGAAPQTNGTVQPTANPMYATSPVYSSIPQTSLYNNQAVQQPYVPYKPQAQMSYQASQAQPMTYQPQQAQMPYQMPQAQPMAYQPQQAQMPYQMPQAQPMTYQPQQAIINQMPQQPVVAPAPQMMPDSVMNTATPQQPTNTVEAPKEEPVVPQAQVEVQKDDTTNIPAVDTNALVEGLKSTDIDTKTDAINKIAQYIQNVPEVALQVVSEPIMNALVDVIKEDTSKLKGPSKEQIKVAEKIAKGEKLTPEEEKLSEQLSPQDAANKNRVFALYTLAMIQKLQRDELEQYIESQKANGQPTIQPISIKELAGFDEIANIIKDNSMPDLQIAGLQALQHVAKPEDLETVKPLLDEAAKSNYPEIKNIASEISNMLTQAATTK